MRKVSTGIRNVALGLWFASTAAVGSTFLAQHLLPLPGSSGSSAGVALAALRRPADAGKALAVHVLFTECRCSQRVAEAILSRRTRDVAEHVLLVGRDAVLERRFAERGIAVTSTTREDLSSRYGVASAPVFFVASPSDRTLYFGGYTDRKQGLVLRDREILAAATTGAEPVPLPIYGCAVAEELRAERNPLGLP